MTLHNATTSASGPRTYHGWQQDKVAFLFGLSARRAVMLAAAVLMAVLPLAVSQFALAVMAWPAALLLVMLTFLRIAGRTVDEWVLASVSYQLGRFRGLNKFASGAFAPADPNKPQAAKPMDLPGVLAPLRILEADTGTGGVMAVAQHRHDQTYTAVVRIRFPGIGLVDSARRDQRVAGWGALLAGLCTEGSPVVRVQALQRIVPESGAALRRWHTDRVLEGAPEESIRVTEHLLANATLATSQRDAYLAFTLDARKARASIKAAGGGSAGAAAVLVRHMRALTSAIQSADLQVDGWLGPRDLAEVIRTAFDPHAVRPLAERRATSGAQVPNAEAALAPGVAPGVAGPAAAEAQPGRYVHDGAMSTTYWVHDWPRSKVFSTALAPLLGEGKYRRAFSLHVEPLGPREAEREVMRERTARHVAVRMRQRTGQIVPEHEQQALARAVAQDAERAAGHGLVRFTAYVTVTVTDADDLEDACAALEADASASRIELRRMWFAQDIGFAMSALPVGMGLPRKRW